MTGAADGPGTFDDHEVWLPRLVGDRDRPLVTTALVALFGPTGDVLGMVHARRQRHDEPTDPLTELAVLVGEVAPAAAVVVAPVLLRDLDAPGNEPGARAWQFTSVVRRPEGGYDLRARLVPDGGIGEPSDVDLELAPVASVLDDALRHPLGEDPTATVATLLSWDHELWLVDRHPADDGAGTGDEAPASEFGPGGGPSSALGPAELAAVRHRLGRHARDLAARHRPTAAAEERYRRPAIHGATPTGWVAACPV